MKTAWTRRGFSSVLAWLRLEFRLFLPLNPQSQIPFRLGIITDELTENLEQALDFISNYSLAYCELR